MIGIAMMMRSVIGSRRTWIDSLRRSAIRRGKEKRVHRPLLLHAQHVDEDVLEPRLDLAPCEARRPSSAIARLQRRAVEAGDLQRAAEHRRRLDAGRMAQRDRGARRRPSPVASKVTRPDCATTAAAPPCTTMRPCAR